MLDLQTQQYIDQKVQEKMTAQFLTRDQQNAGGQLFDPVTGRATTGLNVYGAFGDKIFHNIIRLTPTEQTILSGVIKASSSSILISTESAASSDDLDTIEPAPLVYAGEEIIMLRAKDDDDTVVVKSGTGNIICAGGVGMALDSVNDSLWLRWDKLQEKWIEIFRYDSSSQAATTSQHIDIVAFHPNATSGTWTREYRAVMMGGDIYSAGVIDSYIQYNAYLSPGTWVVTLLHHQDIDRGIYTLFVDDLSTGTAGTTSIGTVDGYTAATTNNVSTSFTSFAVTTGGQKAIRLTMATKNASSSAYAGVISLLTLTRTTLP